MVKRTINFLVTLLFCGAVTAQTAQSQNDNQNFLNIQFLILDQVQPLKEVERKKIDSIFNAEYAVSGFRDVAFNIAMSKTLSNLDYYKSYYKDVLAKRAWALYNDDLVYFTKKMELDQSSLDLIKPYLRERSRETALCEVRFFASSLARDEAKETIRQKYREKISSIYIKNESKGASYNLGLVLQNRERLKLDEQQIDSIVAAAQIIKKLSADNVITKKKNNRWLYERKFIMQFLKEEQVGEFAIIRNTDNALNYAQKIWQEAKSYKIDYEYDSAKVVQEVFSYRVNLAKIKYIYHDDQKKMQEMENFWYKEAYPKILRQLAIERRKRLIEELESDNLQF